MLILFSFIDSDSDSSIGSELTFLKPKVSVTKSHQNGDELAVIIGFYASNCANISYAFTLLLFELSDLLFSLFDFLLEFLLDFLSGWLFRFWLDFFWLGFLDIPEWFGVLQSDDNIKAERDDSKCV